MKVSSEEECQGSVVVFMATNRAAELISVSSWDGKMERSTLFALWLNSFLSTRGGSLPDYRLFFIVFWLFFQHLLSSLSPSLRFRNRLNHPYK